ncbi:MAG TPA: UDP-2,3-diacylglucosamine diphosphatase LpxI [Amphiplicatus sp.]|nr:UDP-2,3-diacylglucosamine diphosphatase LpxI [Amphiplicatus sp.]HOP19548.1 UDP-2,3-diacylglucosamine diphosphatase LpxI [Amphiplicatus sp.]
MARWSKLGLIAGGGTLPQRIASACTRRAEPIFIVRLKGMADPALDDYDGETCSIAEAGRIIRSLKNANCDAVVLAGLVQRPDFSNLKPDWRGAALLPRIIAAAARGDGALLNVLVDTLESEGFIVVGAEEATRDLAAPGGPLGKLSPDEGQWADIRKAVAVIGALGPFDVGQGAVVASGLVLAIEAAEGTDAMLDRCRAMSTALKGGEGRKGVLVKRPKPGQERRVDLPTIGVETVRRAHAAGLGGVAIEAGAALIIDAEETREEADRLGVFVYGFEPSEVRTP